MTSQVAQCQKKPPAKQETQVQRLCQEDPLEMEMETHFSILAWEIPWTEGPGGLQSMGSQRWNRTEQLNSSSKRYTLKYLGVKSLHFSYVSSVTMLQGERERNKYGKMLTIGDSSEGFVSLHCTVFVTLPYVYIFKKFSQNESFKN